MGRRYPLAKLVDVDLHNSFMMFRKDEIRIIETSKFRKRIAINLQSGRISIGKIPFVINGINNFCCILNNLSIEIIIDCIGYWVLGIGN